MENYVYYVYSLIIILIVIVAWIFYDLFSKIGKKDNERSDIKKLFNAMERDGNLYFKFHGYDVIVTFKPDMKVSIVHNRDIENIESPKGAKLTPLYLTFKVKNAKEIGEKLENYTEFLDSIPIQ